MKKTLKAILTSVAIGAASQGAGADEGEKIITRQLVDQNLVIGACSKDNRMAELELKAIVLSFPTEKESKPALERVTNEISKTHDMLSAEMKGELSKITAHEFSEMHRSGLEFPVFKTARDNFEHAIKAGATYNTGILRNLLLVGFSVDAKPSTECVGRNEPAVETIGVSF